MKPELDICDKLHNLKRRVAVIAAAVITQKDIPIDDVAEGIEELAWEVSREIEAIAEQLCPTPTDEEIAETRQRIDRNIDARLDAAEREAEAAS